MGTTLKRRAGLPGVDRVRLLRLSERLLSLLNCGEKELSILLTDDAEMTALNHCYLGRNRPTDVLAFSQIEGQGGGLHPEMLGDVVISVPTALRQARRRRADLFDEITVLLVHGVLHLLGYEHEGAGRRHKARMLAEQEGLVGCLESQKPR